MKEYKVKYWHVLLFVFIGVYLGACLFLKSTNDGKLGFYGDVLNASGTVIGVVVAYYIMRFEIKSHKTEIVKKEEKEIVSEIQREFSGIQQSTLSADLMFIEGYLKLNKESTVKDISEFISMKIDKYRIKKYETIHEHVVNIKMLGNQLPSNISLLNSCNCLYEYWNQFYLDMVFIKLFETEGFDESKSDISNLNNDKISQNVQNLQIAYEEISKDMDKFFNQIRSES
ncbi:hypothetical protein KGP39_05530 [Weissella hellenica]|nr:hypothetical protein [Weissella hellenica]